MEAFSKLNLRLLKKILPPLFLSIWIFSCATKTNNEKLPAKNKHSSIKHAKRFAIEEKNGNTYVYLFGNRVNYDTTDIFILYKTHTKPINERPNATAIKIPCKKIAALSSIYANMFYELGVPDNVVAIDNIDYIINPMIVEKFKRGKLKELARGPQVDLEQTVTLKPDMLFMFAMGLGNRDKDKRLVQTKIPLAVSVDHLEETPLARAEWIKFFAAFVDKKKEADSIFSDVERHYLHLKTLASKQVTKPSVFTETKYGDFWYMPGGKSYVAKLLSDAGANYLWRENTDFGSLPLSFEQVYAKAKDGDYWLNLSVTRSKKDLLAYESRYANFRAVKNGNLYNNTKYTNNKGYSTYWETGMIYPDRILSDMILIFHPELKSRVKTGFNYYERLR